MNNDNWTQEDFKEYERQVRIIKKSCDYLPEGRAESVAADIVNRLRSE